MCLHYFVEYSSLSMVRVKGLRTLPVRGITSTDVLLKYKLIDFYSQSFRHCHLLMISPNTERWKVYFGNPSITRARHILGELKVDFVNRIFKYYCKHMKMKMLL